MRIAALLERYETIILPTKKSHIREGYIIKALLRDSFTHQDVESLRVSDIAAFRDRRVEESGATHI